MLVRSRDFGWLVLTLILGVALAYTRCTSRPRMDYVLEQRDSLLQVAAREIDSIRAVLHEREGELVRRRQLGDQRIAAYERQGTLARARIAELRDSLTRLLRDSLAAAVLDSLAIAQDSALRAQDSVIGELKSQLADQAGLYELQGRLLAETQAALEATRQQRDGWRAKALGPRVRLYWGIGAGVVLSGGQWHAGPGVFVGLSVRF